MELSFSELPKLRPGLQAFQSGEEVLLSDPYRIGSPVGLTRHALALVSLFNGERTLFDIQTEFANRKGEFLPTEWIQDLIDSLDEEYLLDSPRLKTHLQTPIRKPICVGVYSENPEIAATQIDALFTANEGPGLPEAVGSRIASEGAVRAVLVPHMDYHRGNITYGWGFKELIERTEASLFVVVATSHYSSAPFTLTRQNFETPFGIVPTDQGFVNELEKEYGPGLFDDLLAHAPEHSIELELVILQRYFGKARPFRIVPLLVGSFFKSIEAGQHPREFASLARMMQALRTVAERQNEPVCFIISGDLAHIGPKFGAENPVTDDELRHSKAQDLRLLQALETANSNGYFSIIKQEQDDRNICGFPPTMVTLEALGLSKGKTLHYQQYIAPDRSESVSFASVAFE